MQLPIIDRRWAFVMLFFVHVSAWSQERTAWMREAKFGVMTHYLKDWISQTESRPIDPARWNRLVDSFDVDALATQVKSTGAGYLIFTIGQNSGYYVSPNTAYDKIVGFYPSHCSSRDLVIDLGKAIHRQGLKFIVYLPSGAPNGDTQAKKTLEWKNGPYPNKEFQSKWEAIIREWSLRWGANVDGWWFDGCYWPNIMYRSEQEPNFKTFAGAAKAGNPNSVVAFNGGVIPRLISLTPYEDYTAGEISKPELLSINRFYDGKVDGKQIHVLSYLGEKWGMGQPRFSNEQAIGYTTTVLNTEGAFTWDVPIQSNGHINQLFIEQLTTIGRMVANYKKTK